MYTDSNETVQNNFVFICDLKTAFEAPLLLVFAREPQHISVGVEPDRPMRWSRPQMTLSTKAASCERDRAPTLVPAT